MLLFLIGIVLLGMGFVLRGVLERRGSRWSNLVLVICIIAGIVCIGFFAGLD